MKKFFARLLSVISVAVIPAVALTACNSEQNYTSDLDYVQSKRTLVVGITDFAPMDYQNERGEWVGFDADMARAFAENIGVTVEFAEITWDNKILELNGRSIDCAWNGMTLIDEVLSALECSDAYLNNSQVVVVPKSDADQYQTVESLKDLKFAVEAGSSGQKQLEALGLNFTPVLQQSDALTEVAAGTSDAAVIDLLMASAMLGDDTSFDGLTYTVKLSDEQYGVGFRKGSELAAKLNEFFDEMYENGKMTQIAEKYEIQDTLIKR